jgi:hypothetical protein
MVQGELTRRAWEKDVQVQPQLQPSSLTALRVENAGVYVFLFCVVWA